jgi:hypothetical protein
VPYNAPPQNKEIQLLAEKIRALESYVTPGVVNMSNMGLVEGIVIPQKFKAPAFDRYNGSSCPETHLQAFVRKISAYTMDQKLWMYFFQDSLSGGSLEWYTKLKSSDIKNWQDLGDAFFKQYQFNADMASSRTLALNTSTQIFHQTQHTQTDGSTKCRCSRAEG